jgi:hypothetical protein
VISPILPTAAELPLSRDDDGSFSPLMNNDLLPLKQVGRDDNNDFFKSIGVIHSERSLTFEFLILLDIFISYLAL